MALPAQSKPLIPQGWIRAVIYFILYMVISLTVSAVIGAVWALSNPGITVEAVLANPLFFRLALLIGPALSIVAALLFRRLLDRQSIRSMGWTWKGYERQAGIGLALAVALLGIGSLLLFATKNIGWTGTNWEATDFLIGLGLFILTAVEEEIVFRGYLLNNLMDSLNKWAALAITTVLFAVVHLGNLHINPVAVINLLLGGAVLGLNYIYTRNLWFSILFHFGWNFYQGLLGYEVSGLGFQSVLQMDRPGSELLTGGAFGFEGSFIATILLFLAGLLLLKRDWWDHKVEEGQ